MEIPFGQYKIRSWAYKDEDALVKHADNRKIWLNLLDSFPSPYKHSDARDWLDRQAGSRPETNFAIASETEAIGAIGFHILEDVHRKSAEVGYWLGEPFWCKGIVTSAMKVFVPYIFGNFDLISLQAYVFAWNQASARVLEKSDFKLEGRMEKNVIKDNKITDCLLFGLTRPGL